MHFMYLVVNNKIQLLRCCFQRRNAYRVTDITIHYAVSNIRTIPFDADASLHVIMLWFAQIIYQVCCYLPVFFVDVIVSFEVWIHVGN